MEEVSDGKLEGGIICSPDVLLRHPLERRVDRGLVAEGSAALHPGHGKVRLDPGQTPQLDPLRNQGLACNLLMILRKGNLLLVDSFLRFQLGLEPDPQIVILPRLLGSMDGLADGDPPSPLFGKMGTSTGVVTNFGFKAAMETLPPLVSVTMAKTQCSACQMVSREVLLVAVVPDTRDVTPARSGETSTSSMSWGMFWGGVLQKWLVNSSISKK